MTFDELMGEIAKYNVLPGMAIISLPTALSENVKKKMLKKEPEEIAEMLLEVIECINQGSKKSIDELMRVKLQRK